MDSTIRTKKRALLSWELGANLGHVSTLLEVGMRLKQEGWEIIYTGRHLESMQNRCLEVADHIVDHLGGADG